MAAALAEGIPPEEIISRWMTPTMTEIGARFERQEYFVPKPLISACAMQGGPVLLRPRLAAR